MPLHERRARPARTTGWTRPRAAAGLFALWWLLSPAASVRAEGAAEGPAPLRTLTPDAAASSAGHAFGLVLPVVAVVVALTLAAYSRMCRERRIRERTTPGGRHRTHVRGLDGQADRTPLGRALHTARTATNATADLIAAHDGAIGGEARTRLAEARRHLAHARDAAESDPAGALAEARRADALARQARSLAERDVHAYDDPHGSGDGGRRRPGTG
ncbi:hypothetical protein [Streptomyces sp. NPDC046939]|uniref:hypothetical protein n=1 Tax=Streptomyces sp. NPDC046939 TaxID=3155376 RepID=UPI0033E8CB48